MEKIGSGLYHLNLPMILIIQKHYCKFTGIGVKWKQATVLKTDPQRNTQEYKEEHVGRWRKNSYQAKLFATSPTL
jgi:hypothetical protein